MLYPNHKSLILGILFLIITASRFLFINQIPYGIEGDEIQWIVSSAAVANHKLPTDFGNWSMYNIIAESYPTAFQLGKIFWKFNPDILSFRYLLAFLNTISLLFFYLTLKEFFSFKTSVITTLVFALSSYGIIAGRIFLGNSLALVFFLPALFFTTKSLKNSSCLAAFLAGFFLTLTLNSYNVAYQYFLVFSSLIVIKELRLVYKNKFRPKQILKSTILIISFFIIPAFSLNRWLQNISSGPKIVGHAFKQAVSVQNNPKENLSLVYKNCLIFKEQFINSLAYTGDFLFTSNQPIIPLVITIMALIGLLMGLFKIRKYYLLLTTFLFPVLFFHLPGGFLSPRMYVLLLPIIYLLSAISLEKIWQLSRITQRSGHKIIISAVIIFLAVGIVVKEINSFLSVSAKNPAYKTSLREHYDIYQHYLHNQQSKELGGSKFYWFIDKNNEVYNEEGFWTWSKIDKFYFSGKNKKSPFTPVFSKETNNILGIKSNPTFQKSYLIFEKNNRTAKSRASQLFHLNPEKCGLEFPLNQQLRYFKICRIKE